MDNNKNKDYTFILTLIIIFAFLLRYYKADIMDLWADEAFSYFLSLKSLKIILYHIYNMDAHPPLFYFFMHWWEKFGGNPLFLRLPGIILGSLSITGVYLFAKELINKEAGIIAAFLTCISASHVNMCREIRMYVYLSFFVIFAYYFFVKLFDGRGGVTPPLQSRVKSRESENTSNERRAMSNERRAMSNEQRTTSNEQRATSDEQRATSNEQRATSNELRATSDGIYWIFYTICMVAAWYLHYCAIFVTISQNIIVLFFHRKINLKYWFYSQAAILICYIPWYKYLFFHVFCSRGPVEGGFQWQKIFLLLICNFTSIFIEFPRNPALFWSIFSGVILILIAAVWNNHKDRFLLAVTFFGFFTQAAILFLKSVFTKVSIFQERYFHYILPLYFIIIVSSFLNKEKLRVFAAVVVLTVFMSFSAVSLYNLYYVKGFSTQRWSEAVSYLSANYKNSDGIIIQDGFQAYPFNYYFRQRHKEYYFAGNQVYKLKQTIKSHPRVWLVSSFAWQSDPDGKVLKWLYKNRQFERYAVFESFIERDADVAVILFSKR